MPDHSWAGWREVAQAAGLPHDTFGPAFVETAAKTFLELCSQRLLHGASTVPLEHLQQLLSDAQVLCDMLCKGPAIKSASRRHVFSSRYLATFC